MAVAEELRIEVKAQVDKAVSNLKRFNRTADQSKRGVTQLTSKIAAWAAGIGAAMISIQALRKAMKYAFDAANYAAQFTQVERAFENIAKQAGTTSGKVLKDIREMSRGTVSDLKLMTAASRAALFDIPMENLSELMNIAMASATAMGQSVTYMFDSLVTGIGRGQPLIIDNLGLTLKVGEATKIYAEQLGKSTEELTANERKTAILNATLKAGRTLMEKVGDAALAMTDAQRVEKYKTAIENLKKEIGIGLLPVFRDLVIESTKLVEHLTEIQRLRNLLRKEREGELTVAEKIEKIELRIKTLQSEFSRGGRGMSAEIRKRQMELEIETLLREKAMLLTLQGLEVGRIQAAQEALRQAAAEEEKIEQNRIKALEERKKLMEEIAKLQLDSAIPDVLPSDEIVAGFSAATHAALGLTDVMSEFYDELAAREYVAKDKIQELSDARVKAINAEVDQAMELYDLQTQALLTAEQERLKIAEETAEKRKAIERQIASAVLSTFNSLTSSLGTMWGNYYNSKMEGMDKESDEYKRLAREQAEAEKSMALFQATVNTAAAIVKALTAGPIAGPILATLAAAAGAAQIAAIASTPMPALAEGGIVTKPTHALIGESGPEAVIPLDKAGMGITIVQNIRGSVISERQLQKFALGGVMRAARGY